MKTLKTFELDGKTIGYHSLMALEAKGLGKISRLPLSLRILLEALLRNNDGKIITDVDIKNLANWNAKNPQPIEIPFKPARVVAQDFTGVPLLVDLAAMRSAVEELGGDATIIEPSIPVDLVVDHSIQVDAYGTADALEKNTELEFQRNSERYRFLKWGQQAFEKFKVIPPSVGIVHQVNLEYLAKCVMLDRNSNGTTIAYPDTLVGTDSHTTMVNGLGVVGWGVGGIEAEAALLGQPVYILTPEVVGVNLKGLLKNGVTATELVLTVTQKLRETKVVGKFVEFFGTGVEALSLPDRATVSNMCPEYGATVGFFPTDDETMRYLKLTGRDPEQIKLTEAYLKNQGLFGIPKAGEVDYSAVVEIELSEIEPSIAGPRRPQDRIDLSKIKGKFNELLHRPIDEDGFGVADKSIDKSVEISHGSVVIAAITSCTNTSNPSVMMAAGLVAQKAIEFGLTVPKHVKTSLAPGSRVVTEYLRRTGLLPNLEKLGFNLVGYGCTTCIGNSGDLDGEVQSVLDEHGLITASVLSGNRNFEARVHRDVKASFLMSPPLVVAFALAGRVDIDFENEPIGNGKNGEAIFLRDLWYAPSEVRNLIASSIDDEIFRTIYGNVEHHSDRWHKLTVPTGAVYQWDSSSTYIKKPPFFENFDLSPGKISEIRSARILMLLGDSVTTDHISPAGKIAKDSPAGKYLLDQNISEINFNSYGSRRGNDRVMTRGTFANNRIKNLMLPGVEGGYTKIYPASIESTIYEASIHYKTEKTPVVIFAGKEYGTGSSRDWAAKGTKLLGVKAVVAESYERIHRSNLIGMGILPLQFKEDENVQSLEIDGSEIVSVIGISDELKARQMVELELENRSGEVRKIEVVVRIDTPIEVEYYRHGGILDYVMRNLLGG